MDAATTTPTKKGTLGHHRSKNHQESSQYAENLNPNNSINQSPNPKSLSSSSSPSSVVKKSCSKSQKKSTKSNGINSGGGKFVVTSPQNKIRQRKFVVAKKKNKNNTKNKEEEGESGTLSFCKCKESNKNNKCLCVAYQNLRKSQEEFFKIRQQEQQQDDGAAEIERVIQEQDQEQGGEGQQQELGNLDLAVKRRRERLMEEAKESVPQGGGSAGKVMHLVKAFEKLLSVSSSEKKDLEELMAEKENENVEKENENEKEKEKEHKEEFKKKAMKWALPGLPIPSNNKENESEDVSGSSFFSSQLILTSENLGLDPKASVSSSWDSSRGSVSSRTTNGGRRSRRNSLESCRTMGGSRWKKKQQLKVTSQKPFKLRTEERGKLKEEEFVKKVQEKMTEEEKQRIPIAQGLPWTTDEPECLVKPQVKEITRPLDLVLHSDVRAMDRAEFDHQVAEKLSFIEQFKMERERQQKLAEEEEIRRLRKELIPKAQPMPYFDRPFIPRRSMKNPTIPVEPKFHAPHNKKIKCGSIASWSDESLCSYLN